MISAAVRTPPTLAALEILAVEQVIQHVGQLLERRRLHPAEGGDTQHDVVTLALVEVRQDIRRLGALQVHQDGGDDLRVFLADDIGGRLRLHKVEGFDAVGGIA